MSNYFDNQKNWSWQVDGERVSVVTDHGSHTHTLDLSKTTVGELTDQPGKALGDAHRQASHDYKRDKTERNEDTMGLFDKLFHRDDRPEANKNKSEQGKNDKPQNSQNSKEHRPSWELTKEQREQYDRDVKKIYYDPDHGKKDNNSKKSDDGGRSLDDVCHGNQGRESGNKPYPDRQSTHDKTSNHPNSGQKESNVNSIRADMKSNSHPNNHGESGKGQGNSQGATPSGPRVSPNPGGPRVSPGQPGGSPRANPVAGRSSGNQSSGSSNGHGVSSGGHGGGSGGGHGGGSGGGSGGGHGGGSGGGHGGGSGGGHGGSSGGGHGGH